MSLPPLEPWQWALAALAALCSGLAKTGISGLGILAAPLFLFVIPDPRASTGATLLVLISADVLAVLSYPPKSAQWRQLARLSPWTLLGIAAGALTMKHLSALHVRQLIGALLIPLVLLAWHRRWRLARGGEEPQLPLWAAPPTGIAAGFTTMVANAAGPVMILYLLAMRLPKLAFLGTTAWYFFFLNWIKVPFGIWQGSVHADSLGLATCLLPATVLGGLLGRPIAQRLDQKRFEALALVFTGLSALWFLFGGGIAALLAKPH